MRASLQCDPWLSVHPPAQKDSCGALGESGWLVDSALPCRGSQELVDMTCHGVLLEHAWDACATSPSFSWGRCLHQAEDLRAFTVSSRQKTAELGYVPSLAGLGYPCPLA